MINTPNRLLVVRRALITTFEIIVRLINARNSTNSHAIKRHNTCVSHVEDIWSDPASIRKFLQVIWRFVIAADKNCQDWSGFFAAVISEKREKMLIFTKKCKILRKKSNFYEKNANFLEKNANFLEKNVKFTEKMQIFTKKMYDFQRRSYFYGELLTCRTYKYDDASVGRPYIPNPRGFEWIESLHNISTNRLLSSVVSLTHLSPHKSSPIRRERTLQPRFSLFFTYFSCFSLIFIVFFTNFLWNSLKNWFKTLNICFCLHLFFFITHTNSNSASK